MEQEYDGIVVGAGHNAMILASYLCRAGLKVGCFERHLEVGGGLDAHENPRAPGFWHNVHSVNHRGVADTAWYRDLEMEKMGQEYIRLPVSVAMLLEDKRSLVWYASEADKTAKSLSKISATDGQAFLDVNREYADMAREIFAMENTAPPMPFEEKKELLAKSAVGRQYLAWQPYTIREAVEKVFESDQVRALVCALSVIRGFEMGVPGQGFIVPAAIASGVNAQMSKGTSHRLVHSLNRGILKFGGDVIEGRAVTRIIIENGRAAGVELSDGAVIKAKHFVASSVNPQQTFLEMVGRENLGGNGFAEMVEGFKYSNTTPLYTIHLALKDRPRYLAAELDPEVDKSWYIIVGLEGMKDIENVYKEARAGKAPDTMWMIGSAPGQHDPTQAPDGMCTAFMWQIAPGNLAPEEGGPEHWDEIRDEYCQRLFDLWASYTSNFTPDNVVDMFGQTPHDIERHLPNMVGGDIQVGELNADQYLHNRPLPECSDYRTPIEGLYMCGASCHPGGNITGAPGYNAASAIAQDLGIERWWKPHDVRELWGALA